MKTTYNSSESNLVKKIKAALDKRGGFWFKVHGGPFQMAGIPDLIGCYKGRFYGMEVKLPGKEKNLTEIQKHVISLINKAGGMADMVTSVDQALKLLQE